MQNVTRLHVIHLALCCIILQIGVTSSTHHIQKDRQCTYNVTSWCVRVTIDAVDTQQCILCFFHLVL